MSKFTNWLSENGSSGRSLLPPNNLRDNLANLFSVQGKWFRQVLSVTFTVLMAVFYSQSSFAQELLVNPGFESKLTGWQSNQATNRTIASSPTHGGNYAALVNNTSTTTLPDEYFFQNANASPSGKYTFSTWAMVNDASKYSSVGIGVYDVNWVKIPAASFELEVNSTTYKQYSKTFTVPANAKYLQVFGYSNLTVLKVDDYSLIDVCASFTVSGKTTNVTTNGGNDGAVNVTIAGGTAPYIYSWSNGGTTQDLTALKAGIYSLTVTDANKCVKTYQAVITHPNGNCTGFRTQTQGGWGSKANGENPGTYRDANFAAAFSNGVTVGCGTKLLKLTTAKAVEDFLPSGSTPSVLPTGTLTNPGGTYSNVLAGQVVALTLNIGFDNYDPAFGSSTTNLKNLFITTGTFAGKSVQFLLDEANKELGGCSTTYSLSDVNNAVTSVNENYVNGTNTGDFLGCCNNVTSGGTIAANQSGCSGFDPAPFTSVANPSGGGTTALEIIWLKSTTATTLTTANASQWTTIQGATGLTYDSGSLTQTTSFIRCSRRAGCTDYVGESNIITVTITGNCGGKDPVCLSRKTPVLSNLLCGAGTTNYGLYFEDLKGNIASPSQYFTVKSGELTEFCDGTAVLNYAACVNGGGANDCIKVSVNFSGRTGTPPTGSPVSNTHCTGYSPSVSDWYYYPTSSGAFSGTGIYAGLAGGYTQNMAAFQIGTGGGLNEITKFGASSWFKINITNGGTNNWSTVSTKGDINVNLGTSTTIASVRATANPTSICKGESVVLTATIDAASKSANCSPTYSWVGSNGFTSTQAAVTNTNVQGATTYTVTVTFTAVNGSKCSVTATTGVTLNAVCCDNVTNGGQIASSQSGCAPFDPAPFTEVAAPSGGSGLAEFVWLKSTTVTVLTAENMSTDWFAVIEANGATLDVGLLDKTTAYIRCSRRAGCSDYIGESNVLIITVNPTPAAPMVTGAGFCGTGTATLTATCATGSTPNWYTALTGGSAFTTGTSYTTPSISSATSYYVTCKSTAGCESTPRTQVDALVNPNPPAPTVTPATSCGSGSVTLGAVCATGTTPTWYATPTGGTAFTTGTSYTTPTLSATTSYYVSCKSSAGCESTRIEVKATVIGKITDGGTIQADETLCGSGTPAKITSVTPASGGDASVDIEYIWLKTTSLTSTGTCPANIGGQNLYTVIPGATSAEYQPGAITQTTCYIRCARRTGCSNYDGESNAVKKTITNPFTVTATANPASTCAGGNISITTSTTSTVTLTYAWKGPDGFTAITKDVTLSNVTIAKGGIYTVLASNGICSAVGTVQVTVTNCLKLGDTVFNDKNNNGKQDVGEPNIPNVTVKLYNSANVLVATTTTDPITGKYLFSNLAPGDYTVEIVAPAGYKSSTGTNGSATGTYEPAGSPNNNVDGDDNGTTLSGQIIRSLPVTLTIAGGDNLTVDFGLFKPASIGDYVFRDLNGDGKQDAGEGGVTGVKVNLYDSANNLVATTTTFADGKYLFDNLVIGNYTVEFVKSTLASGFGFSPTGTTTFDKDSDANVTTGKTGTITLTEGQARTDIDVGVTTPCDTDITPPVLTACPSDILIKTRETYAYASWIAPTATDNCGTPIVTATNASGSAFPVGSTTVTYTATDAKGNKVTCSFIVNVVKIITCDVDTQAPVFYDCPTDISVSVSRTATSSVVYWNHPSVGDNCGIPSVTYNYEPGASFPVGVTTIIYTAKDAKGNTSYCTFKITVTNTGARTAAVTAANPEKVASETDVNVENQVSIYPNPSNTDFAIELSANLMKANSAVEVSIIGMTGNSHFSQTAVGKEAVSVKVPIETMPSGTYFVNVGLDNGRMIIKKLQIIK